ncbi:MAG: hypothetical protein WCX69_00805 [Candidatus Paceibacterota bacterium]
MFNKKGEIKRFFTVVFILIAMAVVGGLLLVLNIGLKIGFQNIISCQFHSECDFDFIEANNIKDDKICLHNFSNDSQRKAICYLMVAKNSGDERFCDRIVDFSAREAEFCRLGVEGINKEFILEKKWDTWGYGDNFFYADNDTYMKVVDRDRYKITAGKILVLELPVKIILLGLDNKTDFSGGITWNPKYITRFAGAKVKIVDGKYAGKEGWLDFVAISANQPLSPVNEKVGDKCGNYICDDGETAITCPDDCDPAVCLSGSMTFIPHGIKKCCPGLEAQKSMNACIPGENGCSYGEGYVCEPQQ